MQTNAHIQMANYFSQIKGFLNMTEADRRGLRYLLWQILREPTQNVPQITQDVSEQLIEVFNKFWTIVDNINPKPATKKL